MTSVCNLKVFSTDKIIHCIENRANQSNVCREFCYPKCIVASV